MPNIYGKNPVLELVNSGKSINKIYIEKGSRDNDVYAIKKMALKRGVVVVDCDAHKMESMCQTKNTQGIVASYTEYSYYTVEDILKSAHEKNQPPFIIILDKITDPQNLGAIIRSAECLGAHGVIIPKRNSCMVTDTVEKVASGATSYMKVCVVTNLTETIKQLKKENIWVYSLDMDGKPIHEVDITGAVAFVVGSEGDGVSRLVNDTCDDKISISMVGHIDSLNASVSASICMYEKNRQEFLKKLT